MQKTSVILLLFVMSVFDAKSQLVADFVADTLSFCPPRTVRFKDLSTGGNITSRNWRFSFTQSSNTNNAFPIATYTTPGSYDVTLTISDGVNTASVTKRAYIKVFEPPTANFSISGNRKGCAPYPVQIINSSSAGDAPISWTRFSFGDGGTSNQSTPRYVYQSGGLFNLSLQLVDTNGCQASKSIQQYVEVYSKPIASFGTVASPHDCQAPHLVEYKDRSKGNSPFQYFWNFGDGSVSTIASPSHTYGTGVFTVSLRIRDRNGCADTIVKTDYASVTTTKADFNIPDTICLNDTVLISNLSVGGNSYSWDFGDGTSSSDRDIKKAYSASGTYRIKLSISAGPTCFDSISKLVYVDRVIADFSQSRFFSCEPNGVAYTDQSIGNGINKWTWKFSNGDESNLQNPTSNYNMPGVYDAKLVVENSSGCRDSIIKNAHYKYAVVVPIIDSDVDSGCAPLTVVFTDRSTPRDSVASREWKWGDGSPLDTNAQVSHTFTQPGVYVVRLAVTSKSGCVDSIVKRIIVGSIQNPNFVIDKDSICAGDGVRITNTSTDSTLINSYSWSFSDGGEYFGKDPDPYQPVDTGLLSVTLVVEYNGCFDTLTKNNVIYVNGPVGQMAASINCDFPYEVDVNGINWKEVQRFKWDLGDYIGYDSTRKSFKYTYLNRGRYNVKMNLYNDTNGCEYKKDAYVEIYDIKTFLSTNDSVFCTPKELRLSALGSQDVSLLTYTNMVTGEDSITNQWTVPFKSNTKGFHNFRLIGMAPNGCVDTAYTRVRGYKPEAKFVVSDTLGCFPMTSTFRDRSLSDTTIVQYRWFLGAGIQGSDSVETITYPLKGNFGVQLQVQDILGCRDTITKLQLIDIRQPEIYFKPDSTHCAGDSVDLKNLNHKNSYSYLWTALGNLSTDSTARFGFATGGFHDIRSIVTDTLGCTDTMVRTMNVQDIPNARLSATPRDTNCYPAFVTFTDITNHPNIEFRTWSFGNNTTPVTNKNRQVSYTYPYPGKYDVGLIVETTFGCKDTIEISKYINVGGPYAEFELDNDTACVGELVSFNLDSIYNAYRLDWDFGDGFGVQLPGNEKNSTHVFKGPGKYRVTVLLNDTAFDCISSVEDTIEVFEVIASIDLSDSTGCSPLSLQINDSSLYSNDRSWFKSGAFVSSNISDQVTFPDAGQYRIDLVAIDTKTGCTDTSFKNVEVYPSPEITLSDDTVICEGEQLVLRASGATTYQWSPRTFLSSTIDSVVITKPLENIEYFVIARNDFDCISTDSINIKVQKPYVFSASDDTSIFIGQSVPLSINSEDTSLLFRWNPVNDLSCNLCPNPIASPQQTTEYTALITDPYGCFMANASMLIEVEEDYEVSVPNAFTPNADGRNDFFYAVTYGIRDINFFRVHDRWGKLLFETNNFEDQWNGNVGEEPCEIGTYVWEFEGVRFNEREVNLVGIVNIIR